MEWNEAERARQAWAARQRPPLATTKRVAELLGLKSAVTIGTIMKEHDVEGQHFPAEHDARVKFYDLAEVMRVAEERAERRGMQGQKISQVRKPRETPPERVRLEGVDLAALPRKGWTRDQAIASWGRKHGINVVMNLCDRCPSFYLLPLNEAMALVSDMSSAPEQVGQLAGIRRDKGEFRSAARHLCRNEEYGKVCRAVDVYYEGRNFCRLEPRIAVAILLELLRNK